MPYFTPRIITDDMKDEVFKLIERADTEACYGMNFDLSDKP